MSDSEMRMGGKSTFDFLVISMKTSEGIEGNSFGFAGRGAEMAGEIAASALKPFFLGKDPLAREKHWQDFRMYDRWWNHVPIYSYGPFDICLYDIAAKAAGLPLYRLLGSYRDKVPTYASSFVLPTPDDYARQALEVKNLGWHAYKLHPPGKIDFDLQAYRACRDAVGPEFKLMADPVAAYSHEEALRVGRELERLNYYWLEEPLFDVDFHGLRKLTAKPGHSHYWHGGSGGLTLLYCRVYFHGGCGHGPHRCVVEGRHYAGYENGSPGRILRGEVRIAHHHLSPAGSGKPALLLRHFQLRVLRVAVPTFVYGLRHEKQIAD